MSDASTSSILFNGHYQSNVYIFISFLGPSDVYSRTLSPLNFNLWPHLTDQMVFPKINHGFLSADQQLIKRRLIKVVLILAQVWFLPYIRLLLHLLLLYHLSLMGGGGGGVGCLFGNILEKNYVSWAACVWNVYESTKVKRYRMPNFFFKKKQLKLYPVIDPVSKLSGFGNL